MVKLHKLGVPANEYLLYIADNEDHFDYINATLDNRALLGVIAHAYKLGYSDFEVGVSVINMVQGKDVKVLESRNDVITVNWDIVRKLDRSEWNN